MQTFSLARLDHLVLITLTSFAFSTVNPSHAQEKVQSPCPAHLRFVHGNAFEDAPISVSVNGKRHASDIHFRSVGHYIPVAGGKVSTIRITDLSGKTLQEKSIPVAAGYAYTVVFAGPAEGPEGSLFGRTSPFVFMDDLTPPNPGRWKGAWYRMSETQVVIDLRVSRAGRYEEEVTRLLSKPNRAAYNMRDFPAGSFQFNPVMPGKSEPFFNEALEPARNVELRDVRIPGGSLFDVFALGNFLGRAPNSLDLVGVHTNVVIDAKGCTRPQTLDIK